MVSPRGARVQEAMRTLQEAVPMPEGASSLASDSSSASAPQQTLEERVAKAKELLAEVLAEDELVLQEPAPSIFVLNLGESVDIAVRPYVAPENYWRVQSPIREKGKYHLEANGFESPNPEYDINLNQN